MAMSFADRDGVIWFDGKMVPWREAKLHVLTHTLHYGVGVFEGIRCYNGEKGPCIFRLKEHTKRLFNSAKILKMDITFTQEEIFEAHRAVLKENNLKSAYLRPVCFLGSEGMGLRADALKTHCAIAAWDWPSYIEPESLEKGIKIQTSSLTRHHVNISMCKAKACGQYINSILALKEAQESGCDEALLLDNEGYVAEGSGENFFMIKDDGIIYTPELTSCLEGITRATIMEFAKELGIELKEKRITRDEVYIAQEAFFTGTAAEVLPIREHDGRVIGSGKRGPITTKLQEMYFDHVYGRTDAHPEWLTPIQ